MKTVYINPKECVLGGQIPVKCPYCGGYLYADTYLLYNGGDRMSHMVSNDNTEGCGKRVCFKVATPLVVLAERLNEKKM